MEEKNREEIKLGGNGWGNHFYRTLGQFKVQMPQLVNSESGNHLNSALMQMIPNAMKRAQTYSQYVRPIHSDDEKEEIETQDIQIKIDASTQFKEAVSRVQHKSIPQVN